MQSPKQKLIDKIQNDIKGGKQITAVAGALGDNEDCEGYIEDVITPGTGGKYIKFYGCHAKFKGYPDGRILDAIAISKSMISAIPREIIGKSLIMKISLLLLYIFQRRKFIHMLHMYSLLIYGHVINKMNIPQNEYNIFTKELKRAVDIVLKKYSDKVKVKTDRPILNTDDIFSNRELWEAIAHIAEFSYFFLEHDNAYRFPGQDLFEIHL